MKAKNTISELQQLQALPLEVKIRKTHQRINEWVDAYGEDGVCVSFSGGKDSTVLVDIVTKMGYTDIPLVFSDTGLEYPEIREFVKGYGNRVVWVRPELTFKQVIEKYGYPFISKEVSKAVYYARKYLTQLKNYNEALQTDRQTDRQIHYYPQMADVLGIDRREDKQNEMYQQLKKGVIPNKPKKNCYVDIVNGTFEHKEKGVPTGEVSTMYDKSRYKFFLDADFEISSYCCDVTKKRPLKKYQKETGRHPITAQMASESKLRTQKWMLYGCNAFDSKHPISNPLSFWTEQDILLYIKRYNIPICSVYGEIVEDRAGTDEVEGQMTISDLDGFENYELFDARALPLKTTGCDRTGCMFCGYGCHLEKAGEGRFERMKKTHPKQYEYIMKPKEQGGLDYKRVIDWMNEHGNLNIKY